MDPERREYCRVWLICAAAGSPALFFGYWPPAVGVSICLVGLVIYRFNLIPSGGIHTWINNEGLARPFGICMAAMGLGYAAYRLLWG